VLRHRLLKPDLDVPIPSAGITAMSNAASRSSDIQRAVVTAWFLFLISMAVVWLTLFELNGTVRIVATVLFAITAPGWTVTAFLLPLEPAMEWSLAVALSLSISIALSMFMLLSGLWIPVGMMLGLACVVAGLQILHISVLSKRRRFWLDDVHSGENVEVALGSTPVTADVPAALRNPIDGPVTAEVPLGFGTRSIARSGPARQQPNLSQEEIPTWRIPRVKMPTQQLSQEMADRGAAAIDTKMVDGEKVNPARTSEIAWPMPPWTADSEMVDGEKIDPAAAEVEKGETAHAGSDDDDTVEMPLGAAVVPLSAVLVSGPSHGSLTLNADGSLTYSPDYNFNGSDSFTFRASDGSLAPDSAIVTLTVTARHHGQACDSVQVTVKVGGSGKDTLTVGSEAADQLLAQSNNDAQSGADGKDLLRGNSGSDTLSGGTADDSVGDGSGNDQLTGGSGADRISGGSGTEAATDFTARQR
jgi:hypothetical protein